MILYFSKNTIVKMATRQDSDPNLFPYPTKDNMFHMSGFEMVGEFHRVFGHPYSATEFTTVFADNPSLLKFRLGLISEEIKEFHDACENSDMIEALDALADIQYVVWGFCHTIGMNFDEKFTQSVPPENAIGILSSDNIIYKIMNPTPNKLASYFKILYSRLEKSVVVQDWDLLFTSLENIIKFCFHCAKEMKFDIVRAFVEVHRSNMTKCCSDEESAKDAVKWYKENEPKYSNPTYKVSECGKYYVVFNQGSTPETSKILKSRKWETPKLSKFLNYF